MFTPANEGNIRLTAHELSVAPTTLRNWRDTIHIQQYPPGDPPCAMVGDGGDKKKN